MTLHNFLNTQSSTTSASPTNPAGSETCDSSSVSPPASHPPVGRGVRQDSSVIDMDDLPRSVSEFKMVSPQNDTKRMKRMHKDSTTDNISQANNNKDTTPGADNNISPSNPKEPGADNISLTNDLSTSSVEDNGSQEVTSQADRMEPDLTHQASLDYKESNLDADAPTPPQQNTHHTAFSWGAVAVSQCT